MKNNELTFDQLYHTYWEGVYRFAFGYVNNSDWAKDIAQETFICVWNQLSTFRGEAQVKTWIFKIAVNICLRQLERSKKVVADEEKISKQNILEEEEYREADTSKLFQAISELSELNRIIISLTLEGVEQKEIAKITGISHANIRTRIHRIKEELYNKMNSYGK